MGCVGGGVEQAGWAVYLEDWQGHYCHHPGHVADYGHLHLGLEGLGVEQLHLLYFKIK